MVGGVFDHYLFNLVYPHMATLFWMYIGLGVATTRFIGFRQEENNHGLRGHVRKPLLQVTSHQA